MAYVCHVYFMNGWFNLQSTGAKPRAKFSKIQKTILKSFLKEFLKYIIIIKYNIVHV